MDEEIQKLESAVRHARLRRRIQLRAPYKKAPQQCRLVLGLLTKAEKGQRNSFGPTLGLSLTTYAQFAIIVFL